jgi:hypothetical protein
MGREVVRLRQQLDHLQNSQRYLSDSFSERKRFQSEQGRINNAMNLFHSKDVGEEIISLKHL